MRARTRSKRGPSPFTGLYCPREWRTRAWLDGRRIDLVRAFSWRSWGALSRILIDVGGERRPLFREIGDHRAMPYAKEGPGTLTRRELREHHGMTDSALERRVRRAFGIRLRISGGADTPKKRCLRSQAVECIAKNNEVENSQ